MYILNDERFKILRKRFEGIMEKDKSALDHRLIDVLKAFLSIPNVAPVWSCSGHTEDEVSGNRHNNKSEIYITFVINKKGISFLKSIDAARKDIRVTDSSSMRPHLVASELRWCFGEGLDDTWYPVWTIQVRHSTEGLETGTKFFNDFVLKAIQYAGGKKVRKPRVHNKEVQLFRFEHLESGLVRFIYLTSSHSNDLALKEFKRRLGPLWESSASKRAIAEYIPDYQKVKLAMLQASLHDFKIDRIPHSVTSLDRGTLMGHVRTMNTEELRIYRQKRLKVI